MRSGRDETPRRHYHAYTSIPLGYSVGKNPAEGPVIRAVAWLPRAASSRLQTDLSLSKFPEERRRKKNANENGFTPPARREK